MKKVVSYIFTILLSLSVLSVAVSCLEREELNIRESDSISFIVSLQPNNSPNVKSVSSHITTESENWGLELSTKAAISSKLEGSAKVLGYSYNENIAENQSPWNELESAQFSFNGDELRSSSPVRWGKINSSHSNIKMYIYSPIQIDGAVIKTEGKAVIEYLLPPYKPGSDGLKQTDIITAVKDIERSEFGKTVPLTFTHALTALKFKMGFACTVKSITISGVYNKADYEIGKGWTNHSIVDGGVYTVDFGTAGKVVNSQNIDNELIDNSNVLMMIPQVLPWSSDSNPKITVVYNEGNGDETISASLKRIEWEEGKLITYTINKKKVLDEFVYFDLNAGIIQIKDNTYEGYVYKRATADSEPEVYKVTGTHKSGMHYYVYQSTSANKHGYIGNPNDDDVQISVPKYELVSHNGMLWTEFITNNKNVESVIEAWDNYQGAGKVTDSNKSKPENVKPNNSGAAGAVRNVGREATKNRIHISGNLGNVNLYIDNIYSTYQEVFNRDRTKGGISFMPSSSSSSNSVLTINMIGDSRLGCVNYTNRLKNSNKLVFEGTGSLTVADADFYIGSADDYKDAKGYYSNRSCSVIGSSDGTSYEHAYNIVINSGVIYAGGTKAEFCTAIGGGGNGNSSITINGGVVTAVASGTGTAIGGGTGLQAAGGEGTVTINNGNVYAYNLENLPKIPTSAIGGAGSRDSNGNKGTITINGGNVYAESALGTAIGGGSSSKLSGGKAIVNIYDGIVVAKSLNSNSSGIGGGSSCYNGSSSKVYNGGDAEIVIGTANGGKPIVRTGSIGGGATGTPSGKIGSAKIVVENGDIQAQFVMAASDNNTFTMNGGTIRNSYHTDKEYRHIKLNGGAVYMEQGTFIMNSGDIKNCTGVNGGAVYIKGTDATSFTMNGGNISHSTAENSGGALYLEGGNVILKGGKIYKNLAEKGNGGGICIVGGNLEMPSESKAIIEENASYSKNTSNCGSGGGVYVTSNSSDVKVDILSGTIWKNTSDRFGGGLCVDMGTNTTLAANVTVGISNGTTLNNPLIESNRATLQGGGLYVKGEQSNIVINDGKIRSNNTAGYVANPDVANEGGMVTLNGGDVTHVVVTYMPNGGTLTIDGVSETSGNQKIVTATNSKMVEPGVLHRTGWVVSHWHTRPDGDDTKGTRYEIGATLNLSSNITLFAQWRETAGVGN